MLCLHYICMSICFLSSQMLPIFFLSCFHFIVFLRSYHILELSPDNVNCEFIVMKERWLKMKATGRDLCYTPIGRLWAAEQRLKKKTNKKIPGNIAQLNPGFVAHGRPGNPRMNVVKMMTTLAFFTYKILPWNPVDVYALSVWHIPLIRFLLQLLPQFCCCCCCCGHKLFCRWDVLFCIWDFWWHFGFFLGINCGPRTEPKLFRYPQQSRISTFCVGVRDDNGLGFTRIYSTCLRTWKVLHSHNTHDWLLFRCYTT